MIPVNHPFDRPGQPDGDRLSCVAAIHDLSCFGRCALTVILPTLSAMGLQAVPIPTALLSTHTGGFTDLHFVDLSASMTAIADHFSRLDLHFDALYSGFLGSVGQIGIVKNLFDRFGGKNTLIVVDPVMGDDGSLYSTYTKELQHGMGELCRKADIITPNLTEACFLTETPYPDTQELSEKGAEQLGRDLCQSLARRYGTPQIVMTGIPFGGRIGTCAWDSQTQQWDFSHCVREPKSFPGTGDIFASVLLGKRLSGLPLGDAARQAAAFTSLVIAHSQNAATPLREGVLLERELYRLAPSSQN